MQMCLVINGIGSFLEWYGLTEIHLTIPPSFLLFGVDCRSPAEAAYLKPTDVYPVDIDDYREELQVSVMSARKMAATTIQKAQKKQKAI